MPSKPKSKTIISPLRYPGAKRRLAAYIAETLTLNNLRPKLFAEPFAGGAGVALQLLNDGLVDSIALGESDPMVASFWDVVFNDAEWLIRQLNDIEVSVDNWEYFKHAKLRAKRSLALACVFLNRTSFSGILSNSAGPIGGRKQESQYNIDCRFNIETISKRIRQAYGLRDRVLFVSNSDWRSTVAKVEQVGHEEGDVFYYLDPPFYRKAERLYRHYFMPEDHSTLHDRLIELRQPWLLSYDPAQPIIDMYSHNGRGPRHVEPVSYTHLTLPTN